MQLNKVNHDYLNRSKITDKVLIDFNIHDTPDGRIVIPIHDEDGRFIFNKYRRSPLDNYSPKYTYDTGGKLTLYAADRIKDRSFVLVTEGEKDCLVAWSSNIPAVSGTGGAMSFKEEWGELLKDKEVVLCFDNDHAGGIGMVKAQQIVPHAKILFLPDRPGIKDIADYVSNGGNLHDLLKTAKTLSSIEAVKEDMSNRIAVYQSTFFHEAYLKEYEKPPLQSKVRIQTDKVLRAKEFPLTELINFKRNKARCLWHNEETASLHYYPKTNTCYCFGQCGRAFDSIDAFKQIHQCSFLQAVDRLQ